MRPNPQKTADLVTFTEETLNGKFHFLFSVNSTFSENTTGRPFLYMVKNEFAKSCHMHVMRASVVYVSTCHCAKNVPTSHFYVPTCQRLANFSTWCTNLSNACQFFNLACKRAKKGANLFNFACQKTC